jgi:hypothetical protein
MTGERMAEVGVDLVETLTILTLRSIASFGKVLTCTTESSASNKKILPRIDGEHQILWAGIDHFSLLLPSLY